MLKPLKQKLFVDGLSYLLQEIYGLENKVRIKLTSIFLVYRNQFRNRELESIIKSFSNLITS